MAEFVVTPLACCVKAISPRGAVESSHAVPLVRVPVLPCPVASAATNPLPSSKR